MRNRICVRRSAAGLIGVLGGVLSVLSLGCDGGTQDGLEERTSFVTVPGGGCGGTIPDNAVCGCTNPNMTGLCHTFTHDTRFYMNLSLAPFTSFNDSITSIFVGPSAQAKLCQNPGGAGTCTIQHGPFTNMDMSIGVPGDCTDFPWKCNFNDQITTIRVDNLSDMGCQNPGAGQVAIFEDLNFNQNSPNRDCVILDIGEYDNPFKNPTVEGVFTGGGYGLNTDVVTSVKLGPNTTADLFADPNLGGAHVHIATSTADLRTLTPNLNDQMSSITVHSP